MTVKETKYATADARSVELALEGIAQRLESGELRSAFGPGAGEFHMGEWPGGECTRRDSVCGCIGHHLEMAVGQTIYGNGYVNGGGASSYSLFYPAGFSFNPAKLSEPQRAARAIRAWLADNPGDPWQK